jgi:hypothetical protein
MPKTSLLHYNSSLPYRFLIFIPAVLLTLLLFSSCATILNSATERIDIITTEPARVVALRDTFQQVNLRAKLEVPRSMQPLQVEVITGNTSKTYLIESGNSFAYWLNLYFNYGLGMLIDQNNPRRYTYPQRVYIDPKQSGELYQAINPAGQLHGWHVRVHVPYINSFSLQPPGEPDRKSLLGFWGLGAGLDYYHQTDQFAELSLSAESGFFFPFPVPVEVSGEYEVAGSWHLSLSNLHKLGRFSLGYGLSYSRNSWRFQFSDRVNPLPPSRSEAAIVSSAMGLNFPVYFYTGNHFYFSFLYRPSFLRFSNFRPNAYEHLVSIGFGWDIYRR